MVSALEDAAAQNQFKGSFSLDPPDTRRGKKTRAIRRRLSKDEAKATVAAVARYVGAAAALGRKVRVPLGNLGELRCDRRVVRFVYGAHAPRPALVSKALASAVPAALVSVDAMRSCALETQARWIHTKVRWMHADGAER